MKRPRISRICSSSNYTASRHAHQEYIREEHEKNKNLITEITKVTVVKRYVMCFGKQIEITAEEAYKLKTIKIYEL